MCRERNKPNVPQLDPSTVAPTGSGLRSVSDRLAGVAMAVVWAGTLVHALSGAVAVVPVTIAALAVYMIIQASRLPRLAWVHLSVGAAVAVLALVRLEDAWPVLSAGLMRAAFLASLFTALGALREAARTSEMVLRTGRMLVQQPPGRRYVAITTGSTLFGTILNFGAVSLLGGMVQDVNTLQSARGEERTRAIREQRMLLAALRGFSVLMFWCPLTVAYAMVGATVTGAEWPVMMLYGSIATVAVLAIGWGIDRVTMPRPKGTVAHDPFEWRRLLPLLGLIALVFGLSILVEETTQAQLIHGVILVVPLLALVWLVVDTGPLTGARRMGAYVGETVPTQRAEVAVLGNAAFLGAVVAALLPQTALQSLMTDGMLPAALLPAIVPWIVVAAGQLGANPLITATVLAAVVGDPGRFGVDPNMLGLGLVMGWGLTVASSPAAACTMMIGRMTGRSAAAVGRSWNGFHTFVALVFCSVFLMGLQWLL